jgi:2-haloacid dehalogenase
MTRTDVVVFDSNETLLDLSALDPLFHRVYGSSLARERWFQQLLALTLTVTVIDSYRSFDELSDAALDMIAVGYGTHDGARQISRSDRAAIHDALLQLPPHADVRPALARLKAAGFRLAVLTNATAKTARSQFEHAQLDDYFEAIVSADDVKQYKPSPGAYAHAATKLGTDVADLRVVAAHAWDVAGALSAGAGAAFVARPGKAVDPGTPAPAIVVNDLNGLADELIGSRG